MIPFPGIMVVQLAIKSPVPPEIKISIAPLLSPLHKIFVTLEPIEIGLGFTTSSLLTETQPVIKSVTVTE